MKSLFWRFSKIIKRKVYQQKLVLHFQAQFFNQMLDNAEGSCLVRFEKLFGAQSTNTIEKITFGWGCESETSDGECSFQSEVL